MSIARARALKAYDFIRKPFVHRRRHPHPRRLCPRRTPAPDAGRRRLGHPAHADPADHRRGLFQFDVEEAGDAISGFEAFVQHRPDITLVDLTGARVDAVESCGSSRPTSRRPRWCRSAATAWRSRRQAPAGSCRSRSPSATSTTSCTTSWVSAAVRGGREPVDGALDDRQVDQRREQPQQDAERPDAVVAAGGIVQPPAEPDAQNAPTWWEKNAIPDSMASQRVPNIIATSPWVGAPSTATTGRRRRRTGRRSPA